MANKEKGYVYILTNPSFREDWVKIGKSSRPVDIRSKELDNTAVPLPFDIYATLQTKKYEIVEKKIHKQIDRLTDLRIRRNREFFNVAPNIALEIMKDEAEVLDDAIIEIYKDNKVVETISYAPAAPLENEELFYISCDTRYCRGVGVFNKDTQEFTVKKDSIIARGTTPSLRGKEARENMVADHCEESKEGFRLLHDLKFSSPSGAAVFVYGRATNGWIEWKNEKNEVVSKYREKK